MDNIQKQARVDAVKGAHRSASEAGLHEGFAKSLDPKTTRQTVKRQTAKGVTSAILAGDDEAIARFLDQADAFGVPAKLGFGPKAE